MRKDDALGIVFSSTNEEKITALTYNRTMGSVPIGSRYRLIDFVLSNMVNSSINKIGVVTKFNYQSLMDHLGTGKPWDLSKKRSGLFLLPPFFSGSTNGFTNRVRTLEAISRFIENTNEEYVLLSDCNMICNINFKKVIKFAAEKQADITLVYMDSEIPKDVDDVAVLKIADDGKVEDLNITSGPQKKCSYTYNITLIRRTLLLRLIKQCCEKNKTSFRKNLIKDNLQKYKVYGYKFTGYTHIVSSMGQFFKANMDFMDRNIMDELFRNSNRPIYTKVRDDMPARYAFDSKVNNSLIANGCVIEGEVKNSVIFRGVHIEKGAKISNCVIMQDTKIGKNAKLSYAILDKDVIVENNMSLAGYGARPLYIGKATII